MFYLKWWMCECGQTAGHVRGHEEYFESWRMVVLHLGQLKAFKGKES